MGLDTHRQAVSLFAQIGYGKAMPRPANKSIDRHLRELVTQANERGEVIINVGEGYYRPRPWVATEDREYREYIAMDDSRAMRILRKKKKMQESYERMGDAHEFKEQRETWGAGSYQDFEQLRLPL